jgi:aspartate racemase
VLQLFYESRFNRAATELYNQGADVLVLACTELSVIADTLDNAHIPVFDTLQVLAEDVVAAAGGR